MRILADKIRLKSKLKTTKFTWEDIMNNQIRYELIKIIEARFGDLHEFTLEELEDMPLDKLREIASRDSKDMHR